MRSFAAALWRPPFAVSEPTGEPIAEALEAEFEALPRARRWQAVRKWWQREGLLRWTGQAARRVECVPAGVRRVLWITTWTTVGDAILDLAARRLVPRGIALDLCIAPALAPLFEHDARFGHVYVDPARCGREHDFVLLDVLSTASIRLKARHFRALPFATLRGHLLGERFDRAAFSDRRVRQLFGLPTGPVVAPWLTLGPVASQARATAVPEPALSHAQGHTHQGRFRVAIPLGARVAEKRYPHWAAVLARLVAGWPVDREPLQFVLLGHGASAHEDLARLDPAFVAAHARVAIDDRGTLRDAALTIAGCDAFLGVDGGLMHVAAALGVPGLALFARVEPRWFLPPGSAMQALRVVDGDPAAVPAAELARRFLEVAL